MLDMTILLSQQGQFSPVRLISAKEMSPISHIVYHAKRLQHCMYMICLQSKGTKEIAHNHKPCLVNVNVLSK